MQSVVLEVLMLKVPRIKALVLEVPMLAVLMFLIPVAGGLFIFLSPYQLGPLFFLSLKFGGGGSIFLILNTGCPDFGV